MTVAPTDTPTREMGAFDERDQNVVSYLGLNPKSPADQAMVAVCRHYDFDPLLKHVVVIPKGGVYITRDGLLHVAHRSGQLDGIVVEQDPRFDQEAGEWVAKVSVYRKDMGHPFTFPGRYPASGSNKQYAQEMALKAAEAHALRRAFAVSGMPTLDEQRPESQRVPSQRGGLAAALARSTSTDRSPAQDPAGPESEDVQGDAPRAGEPAPTPTPEPEREPEPVHVDGDVMFDYRSSWARGMFFPALRDAEQAGHITDTKAFMAEITGREITSSKDLTEQEARDIVAYLPTVTTDDGGAA